MLEVVWRRPNGAVSVVDIANIDFSREGAGADIAMRFGFVADRHIVGMNLLGRAEALSQGARGDLAATWDRLRVLEGELRVIDSDGIRTSASATSIRTSLSP